jgi:hypothetical protein
MARQTINVGSTANDGSGDTLRTAGTKMNQNFQELYTILGGDDLSQGSVTSFTDSGIDFPGVTHTLKLGFTEPSSGEQKITLPNTTGTVVTNNATQTLTNKTLTQPAINGPTLHDPTLWDADSSHKYSIVSGSLTSNVNITLPNLTGNDVFTMNAATQTLTNKTITNPVIQFPIIQDRIRDSGGADMLHFTSAASAVNHLDIHNAATGQNPKVMVHGPDANISMELYAQGTGVIAFASRVQYASNTIDSASPTLSSYMGSALTVFNHGSTISATMPNGVHVGQSKKFINRGAGTAQISATGSNLGPFAQFRLSQYGGVDLLWSGAEWISMTALDSASGGRLLKFTV